MRAWRFAALNPVLCRIGTRMAARVLKRMGGADGRFANLPLASGWTRERGFPAPEGRTFLELYRSRRGH